MDKEIICDGVWFRAASERFHLKASVIGRSDRYGSGLRDPLLDRRMRVQSNGGFQDEA